MHWILAFLVVGVPICVMLYVLWKYENKPYDAGSVMQTLAQELGEDAARRVVKILERKAEEIREGRPNCRAVIVFDLKAGPTWGKSVSDYTRTSDEDNRD